MTPTMLARGRRWAQSVGRTPLYSAVAMLFALPAIAQASGETIGQAQLELRGGEVITGYTGVVELSFSGGGCTGSMIAPDTVLTAAHCFDPLAAAEIGTGLANFTIIYHHPETGWREVHRGPATWHRYPTYVTGFGPGEANSDLGLVQIAGRFDDTDHRDYLRIYAGDGDILEDRGVHFFGTGLFTYSGRDDDRLRTTWFEVENAETNHIVIDNRDAVTTCWGDSGGPYIFLAGAAGGPVPTIAAVHHAAERFGSEPNTCANNDPPHDDGFAGRPHERKMRVFQSLTGLSCTRHTGAERDYLRCFEIPMVEDVELEGRDRGTAAALAVASIF